MKKRLPVGKRFVVSYQELPRFGLTQCCLCHGLLLRFKKYNHTQRNYNNE